VLEPLCALYDRAAFLRTAQASQGSTAVVRVVERLRHRRVRFPDDRALTNINEPADSLKVFSI
jgi:molybdopterin-guanine dinucleotide biosynthesis protein A